MHCNASWRHNHMCKIFDTNRSLYSPMSMCIEQLNFPPLAPPPPFSFTSLCYLFIHLLAVCQVCAVGAKRAKSGLLKNAFGVLFRSISEVVPLLQKVLVADIVSFMRALRLGQHTCKRLCTSSKLSSTWHAHSHCQCADRALTSRSEACRIRVRMFRRLRAEVCVFAQAGCGECNRL